MNWRNFLGFGKKPEQRVTGMRDEMASKSPFMGRMKQTSDILDSLKKGGPIRKTGNYRLHKGERVLNKKQAMAYKMKK